MLLCDGVGRGRNTRGQSPAGRSTAACARIGNYRASCACSGCRRSVRRRAPDIKPSNIMLESDPGGGVPIVKVIYYGVAKVLAPDSKLSAEQTQAGFIAT